MQLTGSFQDQFSMSLPTGMWLSTSRTTLMSHCFSHGIHERWIIHWNIEWQCWWWCLIMLVIECRNGIQHRKNSWQDGVLGTNCPIPAGWNWTYEFQVKDQIGSFFYFASLNFQRASGGYGGIVINNRNVIPVPFGTPDGDITIFIGDWYTKSHKVSVHVILLPLVNTRCSSWFLRS